MAIFFATDPSFTGAGLCLLDTKNWVIKLDTYCRAKGVWVKDFNNTYFQAVAAVDYMEHFSQSLGPPTHFITEIPPNVGQMATMLYGLDMLLVARMASHYSIQEIYTLSPSFLGHVHGRRGNTRAEHRALGQRLLAVLEQHYEVERNTKKAISPDEAVAIVFMSRLLVLKFPYTPIAVHLLEVAANLASSKEHKMNFGKEHIDVEGC